MTARRVAIVVHAVFPGDPRVRRQSDALIEAGYEVDIICLRQPGEEADERDGPRRIVRLPVNRTFIGFAGHLAEYLAFTAMAGWGLAREHRRRRYDLVQVATVPDFLAFAALPEKLAGVPLVLDLHEDMPEFFRDRFAAPLLRPRGRLGQRENGGLSTPLALAVAPRTATSRFRATAVAGTGRW